MKTLGYTQVTLDNVSGEEQQPWTSIKYWSSLTVNEQGAALLLGYSPNTWDNSLSTGLKPESTYKYWDELLACGGENLLMPGHMCVQHIRCWR